MSLGFLEKANKSKRVARSFTQPQLKNNCVGSLSDFRNLNRQIKSKPYPIPKIREMLLNLKGFHYATLLDLNMGYYHIRLGDQASKLCTIILTHVNYRYKRLPMGVSDSLDSFQEKMSEIFRGFDLSDLTLTTY